MTAARELVRRWLPVFPPATSILPELFVRRGRAAVECYKAAFGAVEVYRVGGTDAHEEVVSQLSIGAASFWVHDGHRWEIGAPLHPWPPDDACHGGG